MKQKSESPELPPILARLQQFIEKMHLTTYQVNKESGLCKGLLINAYTKHQGLTASTLEAILNAYPMLNANWLIVGRGEMLNPEAEELPEATRKNVTRQHLDNLDALQQQCVELIKSIQLMKQKEQADADANLLKSLGI